MDFRKIEIGQRTQPNASYFFPPPLSGETVYSICSRLFATNSLDDARTASMYMLGHERGGFHYVLPYGLCRLEKISAGALVATQELLRERTVLACILPFLLAQQRRNLLEELRSSRVSNWSRRMVGLSLPGVDGHHLLRRCPDCAALDRAKYGFSYWHTEHQLLGIWTCPLHGRPLQSLSIRFRQKFHWRQAEREDSDFSETPMDAAELLRLDALAKTILWTTSMQSISSSVLNVLVRSRLRQAGIVHTEVKVSDAELVGLHEHMAAPLARTGISHFAGFQSPRWIKELLVDPRASHPMRWALLIATTLGDDFFNPKFGPQRHAVKNADQVALLLRTEYQAAMERAPQMTLFKMIYSPRITRAPGVLYSALEQAMKLSEAVRTTGMSLNEVRIWIRRDKNLAALWHRAVCDARTSEAKAQIIAYLRSHPNAQRIEVMRTNLRACRLLERYNPDLLQALLPSAWTKFSWQPRLPLDPGPP